MWTITFIIVGNESRSPGSFSRMSGVVAPGKQCMSAFTKQMFWTKESSDQSSGGEERLIDSDVRDSLWMG